MDKFRAINRCMDELSDNTKLIDSSADVVMQSIPGMLDIAKMAGVDLDKFEASLKDRVRKIAVEKMEIEALNAKATETKEELKGFIAKHDIEGLKSFDIKGKFKNTTPAEKRPTANAENHPVYKQLLNLIAANKEVESEETSSDEEGQDGGTEDGDLAVTQSTLVYKDPITQKEIMDPVKNANCGHIYERASILSYIESQKARQKKCMCPSIGCPSKAQIHPGILVDDDETRKKIEKQKRRNAKDAKSKGKGAPINITG